MNSTVEKRHTLCFCSSSCLNLAPRCCWIAEWGWILFWRHVGRSWYKECFRFSYISICCLSLLRRLDKFDVENAVNYIVSCKNLDGGFGCTPGGESHAGQSMWVDTPWSSSVDYMKSVILTDKYGLPFVIHPVCHIWLLLDIILVLCWCR